MIPKDSSIHSSMVNYVKTKQPDCPDCFDISNFAKYVSLLPDVALFTPDHNGTLSLSFATHGNHQLQNLSNTILELRMSDFQNNNIKLTPGILPNSITHIELGTFQNGNQPLEPGVLPKSLIELNMQNFQNANHPLTRNILPPFIKSLYMGNFQNGNRPLTQNVLPLLIRLKKS